MRSKSTVMSMLGAVVLAGTACGGTTDGQAANAGSTAEAETSGMQEPSCFVRGTMAEAAERASPLGQTTISVGGETALLCYGRPSARDRTVMGGLVPYGQPWRLGANEATAIHLPFAAQIGGVDVEPGSYSIYAVPGETEWEFFLNTAYERWGIPINEGVMADNVGSFTASAETADSMVEQLTMTWESHGADMGHIVMTWENTRVEIPVHSAGS
jgi:hypothetical protein